VHLALLVDVMTVRGYLTPVTRHGINRADNGALMRGGRHLSKDQVLRHTAAIVELSERSSLKQNFNCFLFLR
jgi:DNA-directed RNA polymerase II subunit RPB1